MKHDRRYFEEKYSRELGQYQDTTPTRELHCFESLLDEGMTEEEFLAHVVSVEASKKFAAGNSK